MKCNKNTNNIIIRCSCSRQEVLITSNFYYEVFFACAVTNAVTNETSQPYSRCKLLYYLYSKLWLVCLMNNESCRYLSKRLSEPLKSQFWAILPSKFLRPFPGLCIVFYRSFFGTPASCLHDTC